MASIDFQAIGDNHPDIHEENSQIESRIRTGAYNLWLDERKEPNTSLSDGVNKEGEQVSQPFVETHKAHQATELAWLRPHLRTAEGSGAIFTAHALGRQAPEVISRSSFNLPEDKPNA